MVQTGRQRWQRRYDEALAAGQVRSADHTTLSGLDLAPTYGPADESDPGFDRIGWPGEYPFTRGLYASGYRGRLWTIRQFAGFGNARQTNERYRMLLERGGGGLSSRFDMPTLMGRDSTTLSRSARSATAAWPTTASRTWRRLFDANPLQTSPRR
jgi:methylmalonyl-CoA mutase N-terminal domain/subunit